MNMSVTSRNYHFFPFFVVRTLKISAFSRFQVDTAVLVVSASLCWDLWDPFIWRNWNFVPLGPRFPVPPSAPASCNHSSTLCYYKLGCFRVCVWVRSHSIHPSLSGLFHLGSGPPGSCGSHLSVVSLFYGTGFGVYISSALTNSSRNTAVLSMMYTVVPQMMNPFIYSLRNRDMKRALRKLIVRTSSFLWFSLLLCTGISRMNQSHRMPGEPESLTLVPPTYSKMTR